MFPLHRQLYLGLFFCVNLWSILIHDSDMITGHPLETVINGPAHHTLHHLYFTVNYGQVRSNSPYIVDPSRTTTLLMTASRRLQYFTWADRMGNSYRQPLSELDPLLEVQAAEAKKEKAALGKEQ